MKTILRGNIVKKSVNFTSVEVVSVKKHPIYSKRYKVSKRFHAINPDGVGNIGDEASIEQIKPVSKTICWRVVKIFEKK